jgi:hypothetical protein
VKFEYELLDSNDKKIGTLDDVECSISFSAYADIKRSASFLINEKNSKDINFLSERIKPYFNLRMKNDWIRWGAGIFLLSSPSRTEQSGGIYRDIEAYDKSLILLEDKVTDRYRIAAGTVYTDEIRSLVVSAGITKISIEDSTLALSVDKEYEIGTSKLSIINDLLGSINYYSVFFDENGFCCCRKYKNPSDRVAEFEYTTNDRSITLYGSSETMDAFSVPNKFVRYVENPEADYLISTFINDSASNKLSTVSRGRVITDIEAVNDISDQATLDTYVKRIANERSQVYGGMELTTMLMPHHTFLDCLHIRNKNLGVSEKFIETFWSMDLRVDGVMKHTCRKVVALW